MKAQLGAWNNGKGIELESWVACEGSFSLAVGYATIFWPCFVEYKGYILREGFSKNALEGFEAQTQGNRQAVEAVMNHLHIADIQHFGCEDLTRDKIIYLGNVLKAIYEAKLEHHFSDSPCTVMFDLPDDEDDLQAYEISFWQKKHEKENNA